MNYASMINHKSEIINHKSIGSTSSQRRHYDGKGRLRLYFMESMYIRKPESS